jgi:hypothetical protein
MRLEFSTSSEFRRKVVIIIVFNPLAVVGLLGYEYVMEESACSSMVYETARRVEKFKPNTAAWWTLECGCCTVYQASVMLV